MGGVAVQPVDLQVSQGEGLGVAAALERDPGATAHGAAGAVATDQPAGAHLLGPPLSVAKDAGDGVVLGLKGGQFHASLRRGAAAGQVAAQDLFGLGLGDEQQERIRGVVQAEPEQPDADDTAAGVELDPDRVVAPPDQFLGDPQPAQNLQGARLDSQRTRLVHPVQLPVDDADGRPQRPQLGGQGEAGRSGADDQDVERVPAGRYHVRAARVARQRWAALPASMTGSGSRSQPRRPAPTHTAPGW